MPNPYRTQCLSYEWWVDRIASCKPMGFTRYGDGEWLAIRGTKKNNCDGHYLGSPKMKRQLIQSILKPGDHPEYYRGLWMDSNCMPVEKIARWWIPNNAKHLTWHDGLMFNFANNDGRNLPFIKTMRNLKLPIIVVGPQHLRKLPERVFDYAGYVEVPYRQAWSSRDRIIKEALAFKGPVCYSISAGPPAPVFMWWIWRERPDCMVLDLGSIFDGYCGKKTRKAWKRFITPEKARRNLGET